MRFLIVALVVSSAVQVQAQYRGGTNDGVSSMTISSQNSLQNIYKGGNNDGFQQVNAVQQNALASIYNGGADDGFANALSFAQNPLASIYSGGQEDGFAHTITPAQNLQSSIYLGGINDGFAIASAAGQNPTNNIYTGGQDDGFSVAAITGQNMFASIYHGGIDDGFATTIVLNQNPLTLLVQLTGFTGRWQMNDALLQWTALNEKDVIRYELERSLGGKDFEHIGMVKAKGAISQEQNYSYLDFEARTLPATVFFYRLKTIGKDGDEQYSAVVRLTRGEADPGIVLYPNPTTGKFRLSSSNGVSLNGYQFIIVSSNGSVINRGVLSGQTVDFDLREQASGSYILSIIKKDQPSQQFSIILTR